MIYLYILAGFALTGLLAFAGLLVGAVLFVEAMTRAGGIDW